jgi:23S rRNA U2552 (ribose-2'-O)-methylase RlmE/FtsJ
MLHLAEAPGSFVQACMYYRDKISKKSNKDTHYVVSIKSDKSNVPSLDKLEQNINKNQKSKLKLHSYTPDDIGDLTNFITLSNVNKKMKTKADFITADGGFNWTNENFQEQEAYILLIGEIISATENQNDKGHFVLKIFETFTNVTIKLVDILKSMYKNVFIYKPFTSRQSNSEKYLICESFKGKDKNKDKSIILLKEILKSMNENKDLYLQDIFSSYTISQTNETLFRSLNMRLMIKQMKQINKTINYINSQNYFGDTYHEYKNNQIKATEFWFEHFMKSKNEIIKLATKALQDSKYLLEDDSKRTN